MTVEPRIYTFQEVLQMAGINVDDRFDRRRIKVAGLSFDDVNETFRVPEAADELVVTLDGEAHTTFTVK